MEMALSGGEGEENIVLGYEKKTKQNIHPIEIPNGCGYRALTPTYQREKIQHIYFVFLFSLVFNHNQIQGRTFIYKHRVCT